MLVKPQLPSNSPLRGENLSLSLEGEGWDGGKNHQQPFSAP